MPSLCNYTWLNEVDVAIRDRAAAYALPLDLAYTFIATESVFDSYNSGDTAGLGFPGFDDDPANGVIVTGSDGHRGMRWPNAPSPKNGYIAWESFRHPGRFDWSHGLLQLMTGGGQGSPAPGESYNWSTLINPWSNLDIGYPHIADAFRGCWSPTIDQFSYWYCLCYNSGHPGPIARDDPRAVKTFPVWQCFYNALVGGTIPPPDPVPDPTPPPPSPLPPPPPPEWFDQGGDQTLAILVAGGFFTFALAMALRKPTVLKKLFMPSGSLKSKKLIK